MAWTEAQRRQRSIPLVGTAACLDSNKQRSTPLPGPLTRSSQTADRELSPLNSHRKAPSTAQPQSDTLHHPSRQQLSLFHTKRRSGQGSQPKSKTKKYRTLNSLFAQRLPAPCMCPAPSAAPCRSTRARSPVASRRYFSRACLPLFDSSSPDQRPMVSTTITTTSVTVPGEQRFPSGNIPVVDWCVSLRVCAFLCTTIPSSRFAVPPGKARGSEHSPTAAWARNITLPHHGDLPLRRR